MGKYRLKVSIIKSRQVQNDVDGILMLGLVDNKMVKLKRQLGTWK